MGKILYTKHQESFCGREKSNGVLGMGWRTNKRARRAGENFERRRRNSPALLTPFEEAARKDARIKIEGIIKRFASKQNRGKTYGGQNMEFFLRHFFGGESYGQIGKSRGLNKQNVQQRVNRVIMALKENSRFRRLVKELAGASE